MSKESSMSFPYPNQRFTANLGLSLFGMDEVLADNMNLIDQAYGAGSSINVNGTLVTSPNLSSTLPVAPAGKTLVTFQFDINGNISAWYTPGGGGGTVTSVFGRTGAVTAQAGDYSNVADLVLGDGVGSISFLTSSGGSLNVEAEADLNMDSNLGNGATINLASGGSFEIASDASSNIQATGSGGTDGLKFTAGPGGIILVDPTGTTTPNATGGPKGAETINTKGLYVNGVAVSTSSGTVTSFSAGTLSPLFTTSVATATTTPALSFTLSNAAANAVFAGPTSGAAAPPTFRALVTADLPAGTGTVTSVAMTVPSIMLIGGSPITTSGTLAITLATETANTFFAGPTSGGAATPTFRAIGAGDIPSGTVTWDQIGNAAGALTLANAGNATTFNQTSAVTWKWANTTTATAGGSVAPSPIITLGSRVFSTGVDTATTWTIQNSQNPTTALSFSITNAAESAGNVITPTIGAHTLVVGNMVTVSGISTASFTYMNTLNGRMNPSALRMTGSLKMLR